MVKSITRIQLENFTSFAKLDVEFSPGINVLIGANGTGKTHLLKILYSACAVTTGEDQSKGFAQKIRNVFTPYEGRIGRLARRMSGSVSTRITVHRMGGENLSAKFPNHANRPEEMKGCVETGWSKAALASAYFHVEARLAHAAGFLPTS